MTERTSAARRSEDLWDVSDGEYVAEWKRMIESRAKPQAAELLVALFDRWSRSNDPDLEWQARSILRDDDGVVLRDMRRLFETDREAFADSARNWVNECRQLEV